jgi:hypothetical protein
VTACPCGVRVDLPAMHHGHACPTHGDPAMVLTHGPTVEDTDAESVKEPQVGRSKAALKLAKMRERGRTP